MVSNVLTEFGPTIAKQPLIRKPGIEEINNLESEESVIL
jgi:hypothetical protein